MQIQGNNTRVVVTGGAGFIGSNLVMELVRNGFKVSVLDSLVTGKERNLDDVRDDIRFIHGTIEDQETCQQAMSGARYVWHLAALGSVPRSVADPIATNQVNVGGTLNVLWAAKESGVERVMFSSSSSIYGSEASLPQVADARQRPSSPYAVTKLAGEHYLRVFSECYDLQTVSLRFFNVFGPRQDPDSAYAAVIPAFVASLLEGKPGIIHGDGLQSRDFTYVEDCVQATIKAMLTPGANGKVYNVACGRQTTVLEMYNEVCNLLGVKIPPTHEETRQGDVKHSLADIGITMAELDYAPQYTVASGLAKAMDWYRDYFDARSDDELVGQG